MHLGPKPCPLDQYLVLPERIKLPSPDYETGVLSLNEGSIVGAANGIRTRVNAVRGRVPEPLEDGDMLKEEKIWYGVRDSNSRHKA